VGGGPRNLPYTVPFPGSSVHPRPAGLSKTLVRPPRPACAPQIGRVKRSDNKRLGPPTPVRGCPAQGLSCGVQPVGRGGWLFPSCPARPAPAWGYLVSRRRGTVRHRSGFMGQPHHPTDDAPRPPRPLRVLQFTDTIADVNGVCRFLLNAANR